MKKILGLVVMGIVLAGCIGGQSTGETADINVTLQGSLGPGAGAEVYSLKEGNTVTELHDGSVSLSGYVGKVVKVTGQYSGTTLYVDGVEIIDE